MLIHKHRCVFACAWSEQRAQLEWTRQIGCVCMRISVVQDDDEFINSYSLCIHHCLLLHSFTVWQQCDACRIIIWLHFLLLFINFWSIQEYEYCVSVACLFGHWLYSPIYLHSTQQYVYQFEIPFCILFFSFSFHFTNTNTMKDTFWHAHKL